MEPLAFIAGMLTTLSPCVLPMLPLVVRSAFSEHRLGPMAMSVGMVFSFTFFGTVFASFGEVLGLGEAQVRLFAGMLLLLSGVILWSEKLTDYFRDLINPLSQKINQLAHFTQGKGLVGQFFLGGILGMIWAPCTGPTLGTAIGLAAQEGTRLQSMGMMSLFGVGAAIPLLCVAYASRGFLNRQGLLSTWIPKLKRPFGQAFALIGLMVIFGWDKQMEILMLNALPEQWLTLISKY